MCVEKQKLILPKATHDLLISELSNGLTVDAVVNALMENGNVEKSRIDSVRFLPNIYDTNLLKQNMCRKSHTLRRMITSMGCRMTRPSLKALSP
jgi:hypothetical protein